MAKINDINSFKEFERIPNPELLNDDDLLLVETENGELKSVKYKDLIKGAAKDGLIGDTGPQGPKGDPGVDIVEEFGTPDESAVIWVKEGISPEQDLANNIEGYLYDFFKVGEEVPSLNPEVNERTMLYFQIDETLPQSQIRFIKVPNDESDIQKQIDILRDKIESLGDSFIDSIGDDEFIDLEDVEIIEDGEGGDS